MKHYAIIPARAGSKSIVNKNLQPIQGKRLIDWAIDSAQSFNQFEKIFVSTDIEYLLDSAYDKPIEVLKRSDHLCTDDALMKDVIADVIKDRIEDHSFTWILQPTSPFRRSFHFSEIQSMVERTDCRSVISVKDVKENHPDRCYTIKNSELKPFKMTNFDNKQNLIPVYIRNGSYYVFNTKEFMRRRTFYIPTCKPYVMDEKDSVNIDGPLDLVIAKHMDWK